MRRILLIALSCACVCFSTYATDESTAWTAWLHYGRHMTLIDSNGDTLREVDLPFSDDFYYWLLEVSPDGDKVAYWVTPKSEAMTSPIQITVYSLVENAVELEIFTYSLRENATLYRSGTELVFDDTGKYLAVGDHAGDLGWQIVVLNIQTGDMVYRLTHEDMSEVNGAYTPVVRDYKGIEIAFALFPNGRNEDTQAYTWNTANNTIVENIAYPNRHARSDTFEPTGEVVMQLDSAYDGRFYHDLFVYDPIKRARYPFFVSQTYGTDLNFVQNGERVLNSVYTADGRLDSWILIERDGTQVDEKYSSIFASGHMAVRTLKGVRDGFLYTMGISNPYEKLSLYSFPAVYEVSTRDDKLDLGRVIWQIGMNEFYSYFDSPDQTYFDIAWVNSEGSIGPFKPWAQLPEYEVTPFPVFLDVPVTPTFIPTPPPLFHAGQTVRVQTIDGEILNLRAEPTRKSEIVVYIEDETHLELLEGPVVAEGFSWWRVRLPDGLEGWVVENDGELQTLMPYSP